MKILLPALLSLIALSSFAQKNKSKLLGFYLMDAQGNQVQKLDEATTYQVVTQKNDTTFVIRDYRKGGPMISEQTFRDDSLSIPNGRFAWYNEDGYIDSTGLAIMGLKSGIWYTYSHATKENAYGAYVSDSVIEKKYYKLGKKMTEKEYNKDTTDDAAVTIRTFFKAGVPISEDAFNSDSTGRVPAAYPGGAKKWKEYLVNTLKADLGQLIPQYKKIKNFKATVIAAFIIGKDGDTDDIFIMNSCGYPFDSEVLRVIENSGKWMPAQDNGHKVVYRQRQQITFALATR